jgi:hypothetical protein
MIKDILHRELHIGDLVLAHNAKHSEVMIKQRWLCLVVGENECFAIAPDYLDNERDYLYTFIMDSCLLIENPGDVEKAKKKRLEEAYKHYRG